MSQDSVPKLIYSVYTNTLVLVFCSFFDILLLPGKHLFIFSSSDTDSDFDRVQI